MPIRSLVTLDETLLAALTHGTVVVPSRRLQAACTNAFDQHQVAHGRSAWRAAHVVTLDAHLEGSYQRAVARDARPLQLLRPATERLLWLQTAPAEAGDHPDALIDEIADAWQIAHAWNLWPSLADSARNESHRVFASWAARFRGALQSSGVLTAAELPAWLAGARTTSQWIPAQLLTYGFEQTPIAVAQLWQTYRAAGCQLQSHQGAPRPSAPAAAQTYPTSDAELRAATHWARGIIENADAAADVRIGIAIPDLLARHAQLTRTLDATFTPSLIRALPHDAMYNLSGGSPLSEQSIARDALDLLHLATKPLHFRDVHRLLRSPWVGILGGAVDLLGERLPERFDLATFARMTDAEVARDLHAHVSRWPLRAPIDEWVVHLRDFLRNAGWAEPERLAAGGMEVRVAVDEALWQLHAHSHLDVSWSARDVVTHLQRQFAHTMFAPRRPDAPVQVLGYLETAGLEFTHLWVTGLDGAVWPSTPRPNPYIGSAALRAAGVPRSDVDSELAFATAATSRWLSSADIVRFSCAREHGEEMRSPSPLIAGWQIPTAEEITNLDRPHPYFNATTRPVRQASDESAAPAQVATLRRRGSTLLRDQHACPFKAFARHRLQVTEQPEPHSFPNALDRGTLLHRALEYAGQAHMGVPLSAAGIASHIDRALREWARFPRRIRDAERMRLDAVIRAWLEVESTRAPYWIEAVEADASVTIGGIPLRLRIDRVDRTAHGAIVIDYKTSKVGGIDISDAEPQLPLYALAMTDIVGVLYAQTRSDAVVLRGIVASHDIQRPDDHIRVDDPAAHGAKTWHALQTQWRQQLDTLAHDFLSGAAPAAPREPGVCTHCGLHAICRVRAGSRIDDAGGRVAHAGDDVDE